MLEDLLLADFLIGLGLFAKWAFSKEWNNIPKNTQDNVVFSFNKTTEEFYSIGKILLIGFAYFLIGIGILKLLYTITSYVI